MLTRSDSLIDTRQRDSGLFAVKQYVGRALLTSDSQCSVLAYGRPCHSELSSSQGLGFSYGRSHRKPNVSAVQRKNSALSKQTTCVFEDVALSDWTICLIQGARLGTRKVWDGKPAGYRVRQAKPHLEGRLTLAR